MTGLKETTMEDAIERAAIKDDVYMLVQIYGDTTINALSYAEAFYVKDQPEETPGPPKGVIVKTNATTKTDHDRIVALYTANPPRSVKWIADDMGITPQTVINHLKKEGIYKNENNS